MKDELSDLYNPNGIKSIFLMKKQYWVEPDKNQAFQEWPGSVELWQKMDNGLLMRVCRWLKKSIYIKS